MVCKLCSSEPLRDCVRSQVLGSLQEAGLSSRPTSASLSAPVSLLDQLSVEDPPREAFPSAGNLHDPSLGRPVCKPSSQIGGGSFAYHTQGLASHSLCSQLNHLALASFLCTRAMWCTFFSAGCLFALCPPARSCRFLARQRHLENEHKNLPA